MRGKGAMIAGKQQVLRFTQVDSLIDAEPKASAGVTTQLSRNPTKKWLRETSQWTTMYGIGRAGLRNRFREALGGR